MCLNINTYHFTLRVYKALIVKKHENVLEKITIKTTLNNLKHYLNKHIPKN